MGERNKQTLCWEYKKAVGLCSWSKNFKAVKGWKAEPTKVFARQYNHPNKTVSSFHVIECPEFERG